MSTRIPLNLRPRDPELHRWTLAVDQAASAVRMESSMIRAGYDRWAKLSAARDRLVELLTQRSELS